MVVFRRKHRIIFAADRSFAANKDGQVTRLFDRKIRSAGRWRFISGGFTKNANGGDDLYTQIARTITPAATLSAAIAAITRDLAKPIVDGFAALTACGMSPMLEIFIAGHDPATGLQLGYIGGTVKSLDPFLVDLNWSLSPTTAGEPEGHVTFSASMADGPAIRWIQKQPRPRWLAKGDAAAARRLIEAQIKATPEDVGGPIDILQIDQTGAHWVYDDERIPA